MPDIVSRNQFGVPTRRTPPGRGPQVAARKSRGGEGGPEKAKPGADIVRRESDDWVDNHIRWRWLLDSFEGGERYRTAVYGIDRRGLPNRNLIRHKREYPDPQENPNQVLGYGTVSVSTSGVGGMMGIGPLPGQLGADPGATAHDDDYEYRRARTVPPEFMREAIEIHLGKIFDQEIRREGPPELQSDPEAEEAPWWDDVDGSGRSIDDWMREDVGPLLMALGCLDVCFDRPALPEGQELRTRRDEIDAGQDRVIASIILPDNMVWWREDYAGNYVECLVREYPAVEDDDDDEEEPDDAGFPSDGRFDRKARYRHWTTETVALYKSDGEEIEAPRPHGYPFLPIRHLVDGKRHRTPHVGKPRYEAIAEYQREYYNRASELVLNDTLQSSPLLCMPEDYLKPDQTLSIGPSYVLPMKKIGVDGGYVAPQYISPPKDPSESIRKSLQDIIDLKDRNACLTKPAAGVTGTTGGTVSQSGYSKAIDEHAGAKKLGSISKTFARVEREVAEFALACILRRQLTRAERKSIHIAYPSRFQLKTADELLQHLSILVPLLSMQAQAPQPADAVPDDQAGGNPKQTVASGGAPGAAPAPQTLTMLPTGQAEIWRQYFGSMLQGVRGGVHGAIDKELMALYALHVLPNVGYESDEEAAIGRGSAEQAATIDRRGVSGMTSLGGVPSMGI